MSAVVAIARADFQQRTRTFGMLIVIAGLLELGCLFVPDRSAAYSTVDLGGWRGTYDGAWMGASTALLTVSFLPLLGFFLIRPALSRDALLGTYDLIAATPLPRVLVVLGKWSSNVVLLAGFALLLQVAAVAMQFVRAEDRTFDLLAYALPFAIVTVPACVVTAAVALAIDAVPGLRGIAGGIVWIFVWSGLLATPMIAGQGQTTVLDPLGATVLTGALFHGLAVAVPHAHVGNDISIGGGAAATHVFRFPGIAWNAATIATRAVWTASAVLLVAAGSPFALARAAKPRRAPRFDVARRLAGRLPLPPLVRIELTSALGGAGAPWFAGAMAVTIAALVAPADALARAIAPLVWIWPLGPIAATSVADVRARCDELLLATPIATWRRALARTAACFLLAAMPVAALAVRHGIAGVGLLAVALAVAAVAVALGTVLRSSLAFEAVVLLVWYLGAVNRLPALDPSNAAAFPALAVAVCAAVCAVAVVVTARVMALRA